MLSDSRFQSSAAVDKRGRKVRQPIGCSCLIYQRLPNHTRWSLLLLQVINKAKGENLRRYYKLDDEASMML